MKETVRYFLLCGVEKEGVKDGKPTKFMSYFGYRQNMSTDEEGDMVFEDVLTPIMAEDGDPDMKALSIKVSMSDEFKLKVKTCNLNLPIILKLDKSKRIIQKGKSVSAYFVTPDIDKETKLPRLDKYGCKHLVCVINDAEIVCEKPRNSYDLDDVETYE